MVTQLSRPEIFVARKLFQLEIHRRKGQDYENFFVRIMQLHNTGFIPVKPQGQLGDRKNDGFIKSEGKYYQVYSPEDPTQREKETIDKLLTDFEGLYNYWNKGVSPVKEFYFVLNDKYQGAYPSVHAELAKIEHKYSVKCNPFLAHHLEDIFFKLPAHHIEDVLGGAIVSPESIENFDVSVMDEVVKHLMNLEKPYNRERIPDNPDFDEKIIFNGLSKPIEEILRFSSFQNADLENYFKINGSFVKDDLRNTFNQLYSDAALRLPNTGDKSDLIFFDILEKAHPSRKEPVKNSLYVLMAYFFSYCDIFEEPIRQSSLF